MSRTKVVCLGDSITQQGFDQNGWLANLQSKYQRSIDIVNRGYSGYNTSWLLSILDKIEVDFANAEFAFIMMGANDAATNLQTVEIPRFKENLEKIVEKVSRAGAKKIVLVQTPWVSAKDWQKFCSEKYPDEDSSVPNRTAERAQKYAQAVEDVGSKLSLPVIRLFDKMASDSDPTALLSDGLHFSAAGNKILSDLVEPFLDPLDKMQAPDWKHFLTA